MSDRLLISQPAPGVALLTLNRPDVMNAIDMPLAGLIANALDDFEHDDAIRCIVLTGAGDRAFCSGYDINEMAGFSPEDMMQAFVTRDPVNWKVASHSRPVIAALNGITYGAGALMAASADMRIGSVRTKFKVTASNYGAANATWTLPRIVGISKAKEILMMGIPIEGEEAARVGLLSRLVEPGAVLSTALEIATIIAANPPTGVQAMKQLIDEGADKSAADAYRAEFAWMVENIRTSTKGGAEVFSGFLSKG